MENRMEATIVCSIRVIMGMVEKKMETAVL